ncbi:MAG: hypothetical protein HKP61_03695 [Dactylosporangium sp.]|nr:hypothetical protein [Dactylosporangium sp.]NNJ60055.1 hypothetical protein [Dactylosporangium sp.]
MRRTLALAVVAGLGLSGLTACSWFEEDSGLRQALDRVASNADTRIRISYGDVAGLVAIAGKAWDAQAGFAPLRTMGADQIGPYVQNAVDETGIALLSADYAVSAGGGSTAVGLLSGGQNDGRISDTLTQLGWTGDNDHLTAPETVSEAAARPYAQILAQVKADGDDVIYGQRGAKLSTAGDPSGKTLAEDARIGALADCLGDVVAAQIEGVGGPNQRTAIAVGVRRPKDNDAVPNAVICTAWSKEEAAARYASLATAATSSGTSTTGTAYSELLRGALIERVGGDHNIVSLRADSPDNALLVFQLQARGDIPGLAR